MNAAALSASKHSGRAARLMERVSWRCRRSIDWPLIAIVANIECCPPPVPSVPTRVKLALCAPSFFFFFFSSSSAPVFSLLLPRSPGYYWQPRKVGPPLSPPAPTPSPLRSSPHLPRAPHYGRLLLPGASTLRVSGRNSSRAQEGEKNQSRIRRAARVSCVPAAPREAKRRP